MYKDGKSNKLIVIISIVILILLVILTNLNNNICQKIVSPFTTITIGIQSGIENLKNKICNNDDYFSTMKSLKEQNEQLQSENERLKEENSNLELIKAENRQLIESSKIASQYSEYETIAGYVIQKDYSNYSKTITLNKGEKDGVEIGMTVVAEQGLVGYVTSVEQSSSKVQTIIDTASAIGATFINTNKSLVTRGILDSNEKIKGTYIDNDVTINEGDTIVTSGIGGIYPKNITIGKVSEIVNTKNKSNRYVNITVSVDFDNLSDVVILKR